MYGYLDCLNTHLCWDISQLTKEERTRAGSQMGQHDVRCYGPLLCYSTSWAVLKDNSEGKSFCWAELPPYHHLVVKGEAAPGTDIYIYSFLGRGSWLGWKKHD